MDTRSTRITFYGSGGSADSYQLIRKYQESVTNYGTGVVYTDSNSNTRTWNVTAEIPECSKDIKWKWREHRGKSIKDSSTAVIDCKLLGTHKHAAVYSVLAESSMIGQLKHLYFTSIC